MTTGALMVSIGGAGHVHEATIEYEAFFSAGHLRDVHFVSFYHDRDKFAPFCNTISKGIGSYQDPPLNSRVLRSGSWDQTLGTKQTSIQTNTEL